MLDNTEYNYDLSTSSLTIVVLSPSRLMCPLGHSKFPHYIHHILVFSYSAHFIHGARVATKTVINGERVNEITSWQFGLCARQCICRSLRFSWQHNERGSLKT